MGGHILARGMVLRGGVSGERSTSSISASFVTTSVGVVTSSPDVSSLKRGRSVGSVAEALAPVADLRIVWRATLGFLTNMRNRVLSYLVRRRSREYRIRPMFLIISNVYGISYRV